MLTVCIYLDKGRIATPLGVQESRSHGPTNSHVEGEGDDCSARLGGLIGCEIRRAVIHHEDIGLRAMLLDLRNDIRDRLFLVPRRNRDQLSGCGHLVTLSDHTRFERRRTGEYLPITYTALSPSFQLIFLPSA